MSLGDSCKVHFIYWSIRSFMPLVSLPCVNFLNRFQISTLTAVGSWLNANKEDATTMRDWHHWKRRTEMSWHLPSSTDDTVATRSQFLFNKPLQCAPRPPALPITSMADFLGRRGGIATMAPVQTRNPAALRVTRSWGMEQRCYAPKDAAVGVWRGAVTLPPLQVSDASFTCDTAAGMINSGFYSTSG